MNDPILRFKKAFDSAQTSAMREPSHMTLSTVSEGIPSSRVVLLKDISAEGFVFYTNFESQKGRELLAHPHCALLFYWDPLAIQIRVNGEAKAVSDDVADAYFASRGRDSQLGAWASEQSRPLDKMQTLADRFAHFAQKFEGRDVPRPAHWSGFCVVPNVIEFWHNRDARLHEREVYTRDGKVWTSERLFP